MRGIRTQKNNRDVVLEHIIHLRKEIFKGKALQKLIGTEISRRQIANGIRTLNREGYVERYNDSETWTGTEKLKRLKKK